MSVSSCCLKVFEWDGELTGRIGKLTNNEAYIVGDSPDAAVMIISDLLGWTFSNVRLLADHYAREANATVYIPDFFGSEVLRFGPIPNGEWDKFDLSGYKKKLARDTRARDLQLRQGPATEVQEGWRRGLLLWRVRPLPLRCEGDQPPLVDCTTAAQQARLTNEDIDEAAVPVQMLAPEMDNLYTAELKTHSLQTIPKLGVPLDYQHFPGVEHGCLIRGDNKIAGEREAMAGGKNAALSWFMQHSLNL